MTNPITYVIEYLDSKKIVYKKALGANGEEAVLSRCPFCEDNRFHIYVNLSTGTYHCKKCDAGGSFFTLKSKLGDIAPVVSFADISPRETKDIDMTEEAEEAHEFLLKDKEALIWCSDRTWTLDAIKTLKLGVSVEDGYKWLWYPYWRNGRVVNVKKRRLDKKDFKRITGAPSTLYNADQTNVRREFIIVCEGEADTVAMVAHVPSYPIVGTTTGAKGIADEWVQQLDKFPKIIIAYDNDEDGREGAYRLANRLGLERCYKLQLPPEIKDVNEYFIHGGNNEGMVRLIEMAKKFDVQHVSSIGDEIKKAILKRQNKTEEEDKLHLPWAKLDFLTDGLVAGDLVVLAAKPGVGKTTMSLNIMYHMAMNGSPALLFELEMRPERIMPRVVAMHLRIDSKQVMSSDLLPQAYQDLAQVPFYFAYLYKKPTFDQCADTIRACVRTYGIKFVVFDNLHFLCRSTTDQTREVSVVVQSFKLLAEELGIPILAIARPRKNTGKVISNVDLKDSADIEGDADIIILLHRDPKHNDNTDYMDTEGIFDERMRTIVSKCRYSPGGEVYLKMDDKTARVTE